MTDTPATPDDELRAHLIHAGLEALVTEYLDEQVLAGRVTFDQHDPDFHVLTQPDSQQPGHA